MIEGTVDEREGLPSASEMHRIMACGGYLEAKRTWPRVEEPDSAIAQSGDKIHESMEYLIDGKSIEMSMTEREEYITDRCNALQIAITAEFIGNAEGVKRWAEKRWFMHNNQRKVASARMDLVQKNPDGVLLVLDYKTGPKAVPPAADNWQIATGAVCAFEDAEVGCDPKVTKIFGAIIQPLVTSQPRVVEMSPQQLLGIRHQIIRRLEQVKLDGQPRQAGSHCEYCPVRGACPEAQYCGVIIAKKHHDLGYLSPPQLVELNKLVPMIRKRCDDVQDYIKAILGAKPDAIPGLCLVQHGSGHTVERKMDFIKAVDPYLTKQKVATMMEVPIGETRDAFMDAWIEKNGGTKKAARAVWDDLVVPTMTEKPKRTLIQEVKEIKEVKS